jgi:hypothetical protein
MPGEIGCIVEKMMALRDRETYLNCKVEVALSRPREERFM